MKAEFQLLINLNCLNRLFVCYFLKNLSLLFKTLNVFQSASISVKKNVSIVQQKPKQ